MQQYGGRWGCSVECCWSSLTNWEREKTVWENQTVSDREEVETLEQQWTNKAVQAVQMKDPDIRPVLEWMEEGEEQPPWSEVAPQSATTKAYWSQWQSLRLREGLLYRVWVSPTGNKEVLQLVLPKTLRKEAIRQLHDTPTSGHFAANKTRVRE